MGLEQCGIEFFQVIYVERECFAAANLADKIETGALAPGVIFTDVKTFPYQKFRKCFDFITGGFPCQPFSAAGKHKSDKDPRHLFPYIKNAIRTIQPQWVFLENVAGIISAKLQGDEWADPAGTPVLLHVLRELERVGYSSAWGVFSAVEVGATHQRKRVFILANRCGAGLERFGPTQGGNSEGWQEPVGHIGTGGLPNRKWPARPGETQHEWEEPRVVGAVDNPNSGGHRAKDEVCTGRDGALSSGPYVGDTEGRQIRRGKSGNLGEAAQGGESKSTTVADPSAELADTGHSKSPRRDKAQEGGQGQPRGEPSSQNRGDGKKQISQQTQPQLGGATNGPPSGVDPIVNRVDRLRLIGNGVVPNTAAKAFSELIKKFPPLK